MSGIKHRSLTVSARFCSTYDAPVVPTIFSAMTLGENASVVEAYGQQTNAFVIDHMQMVQVRPFTLPLSPFLAHHPLRLHFRSPSTTPTPDSTPSTCTVTSSRSFTDRSTSPRTTPPSTRPWSRARRTPSRETSSWSPLVDRPPSDSEPTTLVSGSSTATCAFYPPRYPFSSERFN